MGADNWCTPPEVADPLEQLFNGPVDVDPCSSPRSIIKARRAYLAGGLLLPWCIDGRPGTVYKNDPYSKATAWMTKTLAEIAYGNVTEIVSMSMMATSTQWWADMCNVPKRNPRILALKRLEFLDPHASTAGMTRSSCRFEPALVYIGRRHAAFTQTFAHLTRWATWGRS